MNDWICDPKRPEGTREVVREVMDDSGEIKQLPMDEISGTKVIMSKNRNSFAIKKGDEIIITCHRGDNREVI